MGKKRKKPEGLYNALPAGIVHLVFAEGLYPSGVPGKTVKSEPDSVLGEQIGNILEKHIKMAGEKTGL